MDIIKKFKLLIISGLSLFSLSLNAQNDSILIDFGNILSPFPWNNLTNVSSGQIPVLINTQGYNTHAGIRVIDAFSGINTNGTTTPDSASGIISSASSDTFFGNAVLFGGYTEPEGGVEIFGLDPLKPYIIGIFASRIASDNRQTRYIVSGNTIDTLFLNVSSNDSLMVHDTLYPGADSCIRIIASAGPDNNNTYGFYYIGAVRLIYSHEPPAGPQYLTLVSPDGGEYWQIGKSPSILWESSNIPQIVLNYSVNGGVSWTAIDTVPGSLKEYVWNVPVPASANCLVKISAPLFADSSSAPFEITGDTTNCRIVVLGSSTAAGAGASHSDSSWVKRYAKNIFQRNTRFSLTNLAQGGYTTYHILPTGSTIPSGVSINIDTMRNITKALSLNADAIIINMPSNDAAYNFTVSQQIENYQLITAAASSAGVNVWISTSQPRNFSNPAQLQIQKDMADTIPDIYGAYSIDFWNGVADSNGHILEAYDSGDGVHLNNAGHLLLHLRVLNENIDSINCNPIFTGNGHYINQQAAYGIFPNPFQDELNIVMHSPTPEENNIMIYTLQGIKLFELTTKQKQTVISGLNLKAGLYLLQISGPTASSVFRIIKAE